MVPETMMKGMSESRSRSSACFRDARLDLEAEARELAPNQLDIVWRVFDEKHTKASRGALRHFSLSLAAGEKRRSTLK